MIGRLKIVTAIFQSAAGGGDLFGRRVITTEGE